MQPLKLRQAFEDLTPCRPQAVAISEGNLHERLEGLDLRAWHLTSVTTRVGRTARSMACARWRKREGREAKDT